MDQGVKIAAASAVVLGGIGIALLFRRELPQQQPPVPQNTSRLVLRKHIQRPVADSPDSPIDDGRSQPPGSLPRAPQTTGQAAAPPPPIDSAAPPPSLPRDYPSTEYENVTRWDVSIHTHLPDVSQAEAAGRTHKIVDGDTLGALAERYLGSADRALEIYRLNRDVLPSPELLPIAAELQVPPRGNVTPPRAEVAPRGPLVPIRRPVHRSPKTAG